MSNTNKDTAEVLSELSPYDLFEFATYLPGRSNGTGARGADFKRHRTMGHAKAAIASSRSNGGRNTEHAKIFMWMPDTFSWQEVAPPTDGW